MIILLHPLRIPSPAQFLCGHGKHTYSLWLKSAVFLPPVWRPLLLTGGYLQLKCGICEVEGLCAHKPGIKSEALTVWNGDSLKVPKFGILREITPFLRSYHICEEFPISPHTPQLSQGITNFNLLGRFGSLEWLGSFWLVLSYNSLFFAMTVAILLQRVTRAMLREATHLLGATLWHRRSKHSKSPTKMFHND